MKKEEDLKRRIDNPCFLTITGSRLYGTDNQYSDEDFRGFTIPPFEYLIGVAKFESYSTPEPDLTIFSLKRFLSLLIEGDPATTETIFAPENKVKICNGIAQNVISAIKNKVVSQRIYHRLVGYSYSEIRKAMVEKIVPNKRTQTENQVIDSIRDIFSPNKADMDQIINILMSSKPVEIKKAQKTGLGEKRNREIEKYGYCVSSACHAIRLLEELYELLTCGYITFPLIKAHMFVDIRQGKYNKEEIQEMYDEVLGRVKKAKETTSLKEKPDDEFVWNLYAQIITCVIKRDQRFLEF